MPTARGTLAVGRLVLTIVFLIVVAGKVGLPRGTHGSEVVANEPFKGVACAIFVEEVAIVTPVVPVVNDAKGQPASLIRQRQIDLTHIVFVARQPHTAPCRQAQSFPCHRQFRLQGHVPQVFTSPDIVADKVGPEMAFHLILRP